MSKFEKIIDFIYSVSNRIGRFFFGFGRVLFLSRVSLAVIVATFLLMIMMPQGHEIGFTAPGNPFWYFGPVILCSLACWLWVRVILNQEYGRLLDEAAEDRETQKLKTPDGFAESRRGHHKKIKFWVKWVPRIVGVLPSAGAALAIWYANRISGWQEENLPMFFILSVAIAVAIFVFVWKRRPIVEILEGKLGPWFKRLVMPQSSNSGDFANMSIFMKVSLWACGVLPLLVLVPGLFVPAEVGLSVGASAAVFVSATFLVSLLSAFVFAFNGSKQSQSGSDDGAVSYDFPVVLSALFISLVIPFFLLSDRFDVRHIEEIQPSETLKPKDRPMLDEAVKVWIEKNTQDLAANQQAPMVIVATAGGALRAAVWTGSILGRLQDRTKNFDEKLFAISGVSGGALGATAYMSTLWEKQMGLKLECSPGSPCLEARIRKGLSADFLGPVMLGMMSNDIALVGLGAISKDRAEALEEAWEVTWLRGRPEQTANTDQLANPMAASFLDLWPNLQKRPWPALFLNGTHQELGSRIITSNLNTEKTFKEAYDFFKLRPADIAASTAAHNSARFSYISPAGKLVKNNHIIDGGYFENYGAETALEIVRAVRRLDTDKKVSLHVVQIVSDPKIPRTALELADVKNNEILNREPKSTFLGQYTAPLQGLLATRESRGLHAAKRLKAATLQESNGAYYLFNMGDGSDRIVPALNWFMPEFVKEELVSLLCDDASENRRLLDELVQTLGGGGSGAKCTVDKTE